MNPSPVIASSPTHIPLAWIWLFLTPMILHLFMYSLSFYMFIERYWYRFPKQCMTLICISLFKLYMNGYQGKYSIFPPSILHLWESPMSVHVVVLHSFPCFNIHYIIKTQFICFPDDGHLDYFWVSSSQAFLWWTFWFSPCVHV